MTDRKHTAWTFKGIRRNLTRWVQSGTSAHAEPDGYEIAEVKVEIDVAAIAERLGRQAMGNKSGIAKFLGGDVVVTVTKRERVARAALSQGQE